jgi:arylsulfatase A-like enzyme
LVEQGLSIESFLISDSVCCPSRATILRGQYVHCHQVYTNVYPTGGFEKFYRLGRESSTVGTWLQAAGYRTVMLGKYMNGYPLRQDRAYVPPGWTEWYSPARGAAYVGLDYVLNENGELVAYSPDAENYLTDVLARRTVDFIQRAAAEPEPFFVYLAPYAPHVPAEPAARHQELYADLQVPRSPAFNEADVSDKPGSMRANPPLTEQDIADLDAAYVRRVQSMQAVDELVEAVVGALEASGELENTYVIFTSDNGYHMGQHRLLAGKGRPYEEDIVVPFIIRGPGIAAGETLTGYLPGNIDIAPTLAELAGVTAPDYVDGRSFVPLLRAGRPAPAAWRQSYLVEYYGHGGADEEGVLQMVSLSGDVGVLEPLDPDDFRAADPPATYVALRTHDYLYLESADGERELYDLTADPYQLENIESVADPGLLAALSDRLRALAACSAAACRAAEDLPVP